MEKHWLIALHILPSGPRRPYPFLSSYPSRLASSTICGPSSALPSYFTYSLSPSPSVPAHASHILSCVLVLPAWFKSASGLTRPVPAKSLFIHQTGVLHPSPCTSNKGSFCGVPSWGLSARVILSALSLLFIPWLIPPFL